MERAPSVLSSWVRVLLAAVEAKGYDASRLPERAALDAKLLRDANARLPAREVARLWHAAVELTGDPAFGLRVPKYVRPTSCHGLGYAVLASPTVGEALERFVRYCQVVTDSVVLELARERDEIVLRLDSKQMRERGGEAFRDSLLSMIVRVLRTLTDREAKPSKVTLGRAQPLDVAPYERFFAAEVERGAHDVLSFPVALMERALPHANPELARHNDHAVRAYLAGIERGSIVDRTRAAIAQPARLEVSSERIARRLGMSLRSLQRNLREHGTTYEGVLAELRRELACAHLREKRYSVAEVAFALGYDSTSAFARAFRRWTGHAPSTY